MRGSTVGRLSRAALGLGLAGSVLLGVVGPSAQATERGPMEVQRDKVTKETFPALVGAVPQSEPDIRPTPADCKNYVWCDTVLLDTVVPENLSEDDDWVLLVEVSWDDPSDTNDIDIFLYDDGQKKGGAGYTQVGGGGGSDNPEKAKTLRPDGRYNLVVLNFSGGNTGYTVSATINVAPYTSPFESLAPTNKPTTTTTAPVDESAVADTSGTTTTAPPTTLAPVAARPDSAFDFGGSDFEDQLEAEQAFGPDGGGGGAPPVLEAEDVSSVAVVLWLVGVPVLLGGAAGAWFLRRRRQSTVFG